MMQLKCNLFELAEMQLQKESKDYSILNVLYRAILIRKELDRLNDTGKVKNIHNGRLISLYTKKEKRRLQYIKNEKGR
jgi:hypothetical protein